MRQKNQADYDLERAIELFDTALTSKDERVVNALRSLMMIVTLTAPESDETAEHGPLRVMQLEIRELHDRVRKIENIMSRTVRDRDREQLDELKYQAMKMPSGILKSAPSIYDTSITADIDILKKLAGK